jgi:hypothetical protein
MSRTAAAFALIALALVAPGRVAAQQSPPDFSGDSGCGSVLAASVLGLSEVRASASVPGSGVVSITAPAVPTFALLIATFDGNPASALVRLAPGLLDFVVALFAGDSTLLFRAEAGGSASSCERRVRITFALPAPGPSPTPSPAPTGSGIRGTVLAGPTCPVERPESPCPPRPVSADIRVTTPGGSLVATTRSDDSGAFAVAVPPGSYEVAALPGEILPRCTPEKVTVIPTATTSVTIHCDTGIR